MPPIRILVTVLAVTVLALVALVGVAEREPMRATAGAAMAAVLLSEALLCARLFPIHLTPKTKTTAGTAPLFAMALLLPAPVAVGAAAIAMTGAESFKRAPWFQVLFNVSHAVLQVVVCRAIFAGLSGEPRLAHIASAPAIGATVLAAAAMFSINASLLELVVAVQTKQFAVGDVLHRRLAGLSRELPLFLLAVAGAFAGAHAAWAVLLVATPVAVFGTLLHSSDVRAGTQVTAPPTMTAHHA
jgi:hypothetical protein